MPGETDAERLGRLNREFDKSLGEFDREMMGASGTLEGESTEGGGGDLGAYGEEDGESMPGGEGEGMPGSEGDQRVASSAPPGAPPPGTGSGRMPDAPPSPPSGSPAGGPQSGSSSPSPPPEDIPDGSDDDVVARQLRELAENETDPALREKYWDEYRRYKKSVGQ